jgi:hypothetical protein
MPHDQDDPSRIVLRGSLPDWISEVQADGGIYRYVLLVIVSALLAFFESAASLVYRTLYWLWVWPVRTFFDTIVGVSRPFWILLEFVEGFQDMIAGAASSAGLAGPIVGLITWLVPAVLIIATLNLLIGLAETYIPLDSLPVIGRWFK